MARPVFVKFANNLPDQTLRPVDSSYESVAQHSIINDATPIHVGNNVVVYKGTMVHSDDGSEEEVVMKFTGLYDHAASLRLDQEFQFYKNELKELQGTVVPRCYGLFKTHKDVSLCLILQYCGERLKTQFNLLGANLKLDILDHLLELHEHGIQHNDFVERNVVIKDGKPSIIDFDHATAHTCRRRGEIYEGAIAPSSFDFGCAEIYDWCYQFGVWRPGSFAVAGIIIPESDATSVEALKNIARARGACASDIDLEAAKVMRIVKAIEANRGMMPRRTKLEALMREVEAEFAASE